MAALARASQTVMVMAAFASSAAGATPRAQSCAPLAFDGSPFGHLIDVTLVAERSQSGWPVGLDIISAEQGPATKEGRAYLVMDERGYFGTLAALPRSWEIGPYLAGTSGLVRGAMWQRVPARAVQGAVVAIGPGSELLLQQVKVVPTSKGPIESETLKSLDLDRDGLPDLQIVRRRCDASPKRWRSVYVAAGGAAFSFP